MNKSLEMSLTCGAMTATLTAHGPGCRVRITGPGVQFERVVPAAKARAYARSQIAFELTCDSAHTAGLAFAPKSRAASGDGKRRGKARAS